MGVHGAGLQWSLAVSGHDPLRPQIGGVIEWGARKWGIPSWYKNSKFKYVYRTNPNVTYPIPEDVSKNGHCDLTRDPGCHYPDKFANFAVDLPTFEMDLSAMARELKFPKPAGPQNASLCHGNAIYRHDSKHCECLHRTKCTGDHRHCTQRHVGLVSISGYDPQKCQHCSCEPLTNK